MTAIIVSGAAVLIVAAMILAGVCHFGHEMWKAWQERKGG